MALVEVWCPEPHVTPLVACVSDAASAWLATSDEAGLVALFRADGTTRILRRAAPARALAFAPGGGRVAVGDDAGVLEVIDPVDGVVQHAEPGAGADRAWRAVAFTPDGQRLLALGVDGRLRLTDLRTGERLATYEGLGGAVLDRDDLGRRVLALDRAGAPVVLDLPAQRLLPLPLAADEVLAARFVSTPGGGDEALLLDAGGLALVDVVRGDVLARQTADRSSGLLALAVSPDGQRVAAISAQSVHVFAVAGLAHVESRRHGAAAPTGAATWDAQGVAVASADGRLYRPDAEPSLPPSVCVAGHGAWRVVAHGRHVAVWQDRHRRRVFVPQIEVDGRSAPIDAPLTEVAVDRDGRVVAALPLGRPVHVLAADTGRLLFTAGPDTVDARRLQVAVGVVGVLREPTGLRWFDLRHDRTFELPWATDFDLTGGGTWVAVVDPAGRVHVLDPATGEPVVPPITLLGGTAARFVAFVARRPELLAFDAEDVLTLVDLTPAARDGKEPIFHRVTAFADVHVDAVWGLEDGRHAIVRVQEDDGTATLLRVDLDDGEVVAVSPGRLPYVGVDPASGHALEPALGNAVLERGPVGEELVVLRSLPGDTWIALGPEGPITASGGLLRKARRATGDVGY